MNGNSFGITGSLLALEFIAFWGVAPFNLVDYMSYVREYVIRAACNSEMSFDSFRKIEKLNTVTCVLLSVYISEIQQVL
jgi:hypothetical protein